MTFDVYAEQFYIKCDWRARTEDPNTIADRLRRYLDGLADIDDTLRPWSIGKRRRITYRNARDEIASMIRRDVLHDEDGSVERKAGYTIIGSTEDKRQRYMLVGHAGGTYETFMCNELGLHTNSDTAVDTEIVTYPVMKAIVATTIACWEPEFCLAGSGNFALTAKGTWYERSCWITYVPPPHAAGVDLVGVPFSEWTTNGGLLLAATDEPYDPANPSHLAGTRRIVEATRYLNATLPTY